MPKKVSCFLCGLLIILGTLGISPGWGESKVLLRFHATKGKVYKVTNTIKTKSLQTIQNKELDVTLENVYKMKYTIDDVDTDGNVTVTLNYVGIKFKQSGSLEEAEYDSDNPSGPVPPTAKAIVALLGTSLTGKIDSRGKVIEIQGLDSMLNKILANITIDPADPNASKILSSIKKQWNDQTFKGIFQNMTALYPEAPISTGDTWESTMKLTQIIPLTLENKYTAKEIHNGSLIINIASTIQSDKDSEFDLGVAQLSYNIAGTQEGVMEVQLASGMTFHSFIKQHLAGWIKVKNNQGMGNDYTWPISIDNEISMETQEE